MSQIFSNQKEDWIMYVIFIIWNQLKRKNYLHVRVNKFCHGPFWGKELHQNGTFCKYYLDLSKLHFLNNKRESSLFHHLVNTYIIILTNKLDDHGNGSESPQGGCFR